MKDLQVSLGDFAATTADVTAVSATGRAFLAHAVAHGAVGCAVFKSQLPAFLAQATAFGAEWA